MATSSSIPASSSTPMVAIGSTLIGGEGSLGFGSQPNILGIYESHRRVGLFHLQTESVVAEVYQKNQSGALVESTLSSISTIKTTHLMSPCSALSFLSCLTRKRGIASSKSHADLASFQPSQSGSSDSLGFPVEGGLALSADQRNEASITFPVHAFQVLRQVLNVLEEKGLDEDGEIALFQSMLDKESHEDLKLVGEGGDEKIQSASLPTSSVSSEPLREGGAETKPISASNLAEGFLASLTKLEVTRVLNQCYWILAFYYFKVKDYKKTIEYCQRFNRIRRDSSKSDKSCFRSFRDRRNLLMGKAYYQLYQPGEAERYLKRVASIHPTNEEKRRASYEANLTLGYNCQRTLHDIPKALHYFEKALDLAKTLKEKEPIWRIQKILRAEILNADMMRYQPNYTSSDVDDPVRLPPSSDRDAAHNRHLGGVLSIMTLMSQENYQQAIVECDPLLEESSLRWKIRVQVHYYKGLCLQFLERFDEAIIHFRQGKDLGKTIYRPPAVIACSDAIGVGYMKKGAFDLAINEFFDCIKIVNEMEDSFEDEDKDLRIVMYEELSKVYLHLEETLIKSGNSLGALAWSDLRRSRTMLYSLKQKNSHVPIDTNQPITEIEIRDLAKKFSTTMIFYSLGAKETFSIWIVQPNDSEIIPLQISASGVIASLEKLQPFYNELSNEAQRSSFSESSSSSAGGASSSSSSQSDVMRGYKSNLAVKMYLKGLRKDYLDGWYDELIRPIKPHLPTNDQQTVTIIPDERLAEIPFGVLYDKLEKKFFIEKHPISITPSLKTLQFLDLLSLERQVSPNCETLVIGNPISPADLRPLPIAQREAELVSDLLHGRKEDLLLLENATVKRFGEKAPKARWIFAACHGEQGSHSKSKPHSVFQGRLKLSRDPVDMDGGNLDSELISRLNLVADSVFLSACYSGTGKRQREGVIGPVWSFLAAGALSTVATYWPLPDSIVTTKMVERFYQHMLGKGDFPKLNKAQSLREAMLLGMKETEKDYFQQWGAFYLSGVIDSKSSTHKSSGPARLV